MLWTPVTFLYRCFKDLFLFLYAQNRIRLTAERPLSLVLMNLLLKELKQKEAICYQHKLPLM